MTDMPLPPAADAARALDAQALARLRELDPDGRSGVVARVMQAFETSLVRQMAQLIESRDKGDAAAIGQLAHTLKSSSASLGALALSACCAEVEQAVRAGETADLAPRVDQLLSQAQAALSAVRAMLRDQSPPS
jgi:HPt (histidine-containing phosphotransfer) domain-containing protein